MPSRTLLFKVILIYTLLLGGLYRSAFIGALFSECFCWGAFVGALLSGCFCRGALVEALLSKRSGWGALAKVLLSGHFRRALLSKQPFSKYKYRKIAFQKLWLKKLLEFLHIKSFRYKAQCGMSL